MQIGVIEKNLVSMAETIEETLPPIIEAVQQSLTPFMEALIEIYRAWPRHPGSGRPLKVYELMNESMAAVYVVQPEVYRKDPLILRRYLKALEVDMGTGFEETALWELLGEEFKNKKFVVAVMRYGNYTTKEIAKKLGVTESTIRDHAKAVRENQDIKALFDRWRGKSGKPEKIRDKTRRYA